MKHILVGVFLLAFLFTLTPSLPTEVASDQVSERSAISPLGDRYNSADSFITLDGKNVGMVQYMDAVLKESTLQTPSHSVTSDISWTQDGIYSIPQISHPSLQSAGSDFDQCLKDHKINFERYEDRVAVDVNKNQFGFSDAPDSAYSQLAEFTRKKARLSSFPINIYGKDIDCPMDWFGSGTATAMSVYYVPGTTLSFVIWSTVDHNINTETYFDFKATKWEILGQSAIPVACVTDQSCILITANDRNIFPLDMFAELSIGVKDVKQGDLILGYGCSMDLEVVLRTRTIKVEHFCEGVQGTLMQSNSMSHLIVGGNLCLFYPAMPGFSGSSVFKWSNIDNKQKVQQIGVLNSGYPGVYSCIWTLPATILTDIQDKLRALAEQLKPETVDTPKDTDSSTRDVVEWKNWDKLDATSQQLWTKAYTANEDFKWLIDNNCAGLEFITDSISLCIAYDDNFSKDVKALKVGISGKLHKWEKLIPNWTLVSLESIK